MADPPAILKGVRHRADTLEVERQSPEEELVAFYATKGDQEFSWDVTATLAASLKTYFESEGWNVTLSVGEGPRRRHFPRVSRRPIGR